MTDIFVRAVAVACLFLSACASDGHLITVQEAYARSSWKGHRIGEALVKWGFPLMPPEHAADGTTVYRWLGQASYAYDEQTGHADTNYGTVNIYEKRIGRAGCSLSITTDANGIITKLETTQQIRACNDSFFSTGLAPDEQTAAEGKVLEGQMRAVRVIDERFRMLCSSARYSDLFDESHCDTGVIAYPVNVKLSQEERKVLLTWNKEMNAVADDYRAFFLGTGRPGEVNFIRMVDSVGAPPRLDEASLLDEKKTGHLVMLVSRTALRVNQLVQHSKSTYHQFGQ